MIIWIVGPWGSGKSTITKGVLEQLGMPIDPKLKSKISSIFKTNIHYIGRTKGADCVLGSDGVMLGKDKFKSFVAKYYENFNYTFFEGVKFFDETVLDYFVKENLNFKVFYLSVPVETISKRRQNRGTPSDLKEKDYEKAYNKQTEKYNSIISKFKSNIEIREHLNSNDTNKIIKEIYEIISN